MGHSLCGKALVPLSPSRLEDLPDSPMSAESFSCLTPDAIALLQRHGLLEPLIKAELIACELAMISIDSEEQQQCLNSFCSQKGFNDEGQFNIWLQKSQLTRERFLQQLIDPLRLERLCRDRFGHRVEMRFLERKQILDQVVYSLIRVHDPFKARELYLQIVEGEADFGAIAAVHSEGPERLTRGIVGPAPLIRAHPRVVDLLRSSQPGEVREPIQIENWHLVLRLESLTPAVLDRTMESHLAKELFDEWIEEEARRKLDQLLCLPAPVIPVVQG